MTDHDLSNELQSRVRDAAGRGVPLAIQGGGSKAFYGRTVTGETLDVAGHRGVVSYEPTELVITARAGTPLTEVEALLAERGQMLPFEPPHFTAPGQISAAIVGGMVAAGLSGPGRPWTGAVRDAVLGVKILNARGEVLGFGGQVMKNVAGYDLSRLMAGSMGTLGVILEVSLKVLPKPAQMTTLVQVANAAEAARHLAAWGRQPLPISASLHQADRLYIRLSVTALGVAVSPQDHRRRGLVCARRQERARRATPGWFDPDGAVGRPAGRDGVLHIVPRLWRRDRRDQQTRTRHRPRLEPQPLCASGSPRKPTSPSKNSCRRSGEPSRRPLPLTCSPKSLLISRPPRRPRRTSMPNWRAPFLTIRRFSRARCGA